MFCVYWDASTCGNEQQHIRVMNQGSIFIYLHAAKHAIWGDVGKDVIGKIVIGKIAIGEIPFVKMSDSKNVISKNVGW